MIVQVLGRNGNTKLDRDMKKLLYAIIGSLFIVTLVYQNVQSQSFGVRYDLTTCTGIDQNGNTFDGAHCKDEKENGPCDKESVCYENEEEGLDPGFF